jgi:hypothetical protein
MNCIFMFIINCLLHKRLYYLSIQTWSPLRPSIYFTSSLGKSLWQHIIVIKRSSCILFQWIITIIISIKIAQIFQFKIIVILITPTLIIHKSKKRVVSLIWLFGWFLRFFFNFFLYSQTVEITYLRKITHF